ncbi:hypothetical protein B7494_g463 [Chlorociboria aeruginascens]|nr:hypothetical protein B7494_g463 [Chlorociboria aeruginascens]
MFQESYLTQVPASFKSIYSDQRHKIRHYAITLHRYGTPGIELPSTIILLSLILRWSETSNPAFRKRGCILLFLRPHQAIKQGPSQNKATKPLDQTSAPKLQAAPKISPHAISPSALLHHARPHSERIHERARQQREEHVEQEPRVRFQAKDAGADAEERGCEVVKRGEGLHDGRFSGGFGRAES